MTAKTQKHDSDRARIETLERENQLLKEGLQQAERIRNLWDEAVNELQIAKAELSTLYRISVALRETTDPDELYRKVLDIVAEALNLAPDAERGIFLVEGGAMKIVARSTSTPGFAQAHEGMMVGTCLCGMAAAGGEIVTTAQCAKDPRHTLPWILGRPHGHVIIPLKAYNRVVGVLYCYVAENTSFDERHLNLFRAIGDQLGSAIDNARLYEEKRLAALHDALTGLDNRRSMELALNRLLAEARRYQLPLSVAMADIDFFKRYNDTHGHLEGDALLREVARLLRCTLRGTDLAVRYGGEEFLLIFPHTPIAEATALAERLRRTVEASTTVTISIGVATLAAQCDTPDRLVEAADAAMYMAKQAGRNRVVSAP